MAKNERQHTGRHSPDFRATMRAEHRRKLEAMMRVADAKAKSMEASGHTRMSRVYQNACEQLFNHQNDAYILTLQELRRIPVDIHEYLESSDFVGGLEMEIWPQIRRDIVAVCPDIWCGAAPVKEYIDSGATGTGKTLKASIVTSYQLYLLHCLHSPKRFYGQAESTPIVFSMASSNVTTTRDVLFRPFRDIVTGMRFYRNYTSWNRDKTSKLEFSNGIHVEPVTATNQGIIGRAIIGAHIDEANYMSVVEGSKRAEHQGSRGVYDQAELFHRQVTLRRRSRFSSRMPVPGMIILSSSIRHTDDFLERRISQVRSVKYVDEATGEERQGEPGVEIFRHKQYEVQPAHRFSDKLFRLLVGTPEYATRVLEDHERAGEHYPEDGVVEMVPTDYLYDFKHQPEDALRDVCGISTVNLSPFITQRHKIIEAVTRWKEAGNKHPVRRANVDLVEHGMPVLIPEDLDADETSPRFAHIDLSKTKDRCGIAVVRVDRMQEIEVSSGVFQRLPFGVVELAISIQPSQAKELDIAAVRDWVVSLRNVHRVPIYRITYDGYNSAESIQAITRLGIRSKIISMDRNDGPYEAVRRALYQDRLDLPPNEILTRELQQLDKNQKSGKIDHPAKGSKDISDAVAGAWTSAITSREIRAQIYYTDGKGKRITPPRTRSRRRTQTPLPDEQQ